MRGISVSLSLITLIGVSACSGSSNSVDTVEVAAAASVLGTDPATITFDSGTDALTVVTDGGATVDFGTPLSVQNGWLRYSINDGRALVSESDDGSSFAAVITGDVQDGIATQEIRRIGVTNLPTSGAASYTGIYGAYIVPTDTTDPFNRVFGDVTLNVDFAGSQVDGSITGRTADVDTVSDVALELGSLDGTGAFSGSTGQTTVNGTTGSTTGSGSYTGLISGADADAVVGTVTIDYDPGGFYGAATELGVFILESTP